MTGNTALTGQRPVQRDGGVVGVLAHDGRDVSQHEALDLGPRHVHVQEVSLGVEAATARPARHLLRHLKQRNTHTTNQQQQPHNQ